MKKKLYIIFSTVVIVLLLVLFFIVFLKQYTICIISPDVCRELSPNTPQQFVMTGGKYSPFEDNYMFATILRNGNLLVIVSDDQKKNIVENDKESLKKWSGIATDEVQISNNYSKVTVNCCKESTSNIMYSLLLIEECLLHQILDGKKPNELCVEYEIYDSQTGELRYSSEYMKGDMTFSIKELELSSMYD